MQRNIALILAAMCALAVPGRAAAALPKSSATTVAACHTAVVFGNTSSSEYATTFRAFIDVACPSGVPFSAALRSARGCELRSDRGPAVRYELYSDTSMRTAIVSCERPTIAITGSGHQRFVLYGRLESPIETVGELSDVLLATLSP